MRGYATIGRWRRRSNGCGSSRQGGKKRPIGQPFCEDKIVQRAVVMRVEASFDQDFQECSHGFRQGLSPQQALHELREPCRKLNIN
jgi:RNA-directed DNA polymerase